MVFEKEKELVEQVPENQTTGLDEVPLSDNVEVPRPDTTANDNNVDLAQQSDDNEIMEQPLNSPANGDTNGDSNTAQSLHTIDQQSTYSTSQMSPIKRLPTTTSHINESVSISFLKSSFESILAVKEVMKKHQNIVVKATTVLEILKSGGIPSEELIFEPLKLTCEQSNIEAKILALDCLSKIFTFNLFTKPIYLDYKSNNSHPKSPTESDMDGDLNVAIKDGNVLLIEAAINVVVSCYEGEGTDEKVEMQIIRVLTGAVVNESMPVHGKALLQAIRQINNIFLHSLTPVNQGIAQATLIQIVNSVYDKVLQLKHLRSLKKLDSTMNMQSLDITSHQEQQVTLQQLQDTSNDNIQLPSDEIIGDDDELYVKDAFLIFRSFSNLASKLIEVDSLDMRSHQVRVKLLSLYIIHYILKNYNDVFLDKKHLIFNKNNDETTYLVDGIRKYLCLALSRNATSQLAPVYEVTIEIYWLLIKNLRTEFKYEIPVFMDEIYFPVSDMKASTVYQKRFILELVRRLSSDSKILVEFYLNYDCDTVLPNMCERIVDYLTKFALMRVESTSQQKLNFIQFQKSHTLTKELDTIPELSSNKLSSTPPNPDAAINFPNNFALKMMAIDYIVVFLHSLNTSCGIPAKLAETTSSLNIDQLTSAVNESRIRNGSIASSSNIRLSRSNSNAQTPSIAEEDEGSGSYQFDTAKQRKTALIEGIKLFNYSPKKGIAFLDKNGFIDKSNPESIAKFILDNDSLDKTQVGEYLGGSKEENIAVMHSFVDSMEFKNRSFLDALRSFLQHFRLPGESQVIDRFMLKFAEKYVNDNPKAFANADAVYVLSYSVIMLNTDQHSPQIKKRMTLEEFLKNNRGIDDGNDLDPKFLEEVFYDIQRNEIILNSEQQAALVSSDATQSVLTASFFGRDYAKEAYTKASKALSKKTENTVISLGKLQKKNNKYYYFDSASAPEHIRSIFETLWMSFLAGLTPPFKEYDDEQICTVLLLGIRLATHLACIFNLEYARTSFMRALVQFCDINNPESMSLKNIKAIHTLLNIAVQENSYLGSAWKGVFIVISQVERLRLLSKGVDSSSVPDLINARFAKPSIDLKPDENNGFFFTFGGSKRQSVSQQALSHHFNQKLSADMANQLTSVELDVAIDKVFSNSSEIQGKGIFDFVEGLVEVAREEIKSSGDNKEPRLFCLQKLVDVCYYNMSRIRLQWSELWKVMNQEFNEFGCNTNTAVSFFAIDSLRQLSERFFDIDELSHFKFQREFLKPFDYIILNNPNIEVKEMVLDSIVYLIMKKASHIKSGWSTILQILSHIAYIEEDEKIVATGLSYVNKIIEKHTKDIEAENAFDDLIDCLAEYAKNDRFQKISLRALAMINVLVEKAGNEVDKNINDDDYLIKTWLPLLLSFNNIVMEGNELEVRSHALNCMFDALNAHGKNFDVEFWSKICKELLFPIFDILKTHGEISLVKNESLWVWLSSTLIQALRKMINLFTTFFDKLDNMIDMFLSLLVSCICQDNDAISKIGISCLQELILSNMHKFDVSDWSKIEITFEELFKLTTATELFDLDPLLKDKKKVDVSNNIGSTEETGINNDIIIEGEDNNIELEQSYSEIIPHKKFSSQEIIIKCVLHLHMIQLLSELFDKSEFYTTIPYENLIALSKLLESSYEFAKKFNEDYKLRVRLWNSGVVDKLPNLLKQETSAIGVYISILFRLYSDESKSSMEARDKIVDTLIPISVDLLERWHDFATREEVRNMESWTPVVVEILQALTELRETDFKKVTPFAYSHAIALLISPLNSELREVLQAYLQRVGILYIHQLK
ncbi:hypothetical protein CANINC_001889 [Pichia inconspicua]|uniref:SEC7 domain-containing protein n=1 Tax=Pichia inconspicua TaxID=52247 RepID=A0A4T0X431_9ASCO|nr:hypothetical protein CANINC_001889 [[Candida] inconspicua]